jgi:HAD superfamily hydrolase (TIGR01509 family)
VISDNRVRARQWRSLVAEYFPPRLGGEPARWSEANRTIFRQAFERLSDRLEGWQADLRYESFIDAYYVDWLRSMCEEVGVAAPASDQACIDLSRAADEWIIPRVRAAFPGVPEAIASLSDDYRLFTASTGSSREIGLYLAGLGVRDRFERLYGPDLVETPKNRVAYYERIIADAGLEPARVLVADDSPRMVAYAVAAGARAVFVGAAAAAPTGVATIDALAELPSLLRAL